MQLFFSKSIPDLTNVVLVESGPRSLYDNYIGHLYEQYGDQIRINLVTCYAGKPEGFRESNGKIYRVQDYRGWDGAKRMAEELRTQGPTILGILCAGVPVMSKWKWLLTAALPSKVFVMNENGDYFWADYTNWKIILHFMAFRAGMSGEGGVWLPLRMLVFPFGMAYFAAYAAWLHGRRWLRNI
ncbi:hypothetical protein [Bryobacter aggregatus]|uniref:hypothetical protein n=1 Tax=Bryobacter aggregatus TaxID=360054 RepID=UPI0004E1C749|nr:hypothetical protein [Bryobacter aggregatus]